MPRLSFARTLNTYVPGARLENSAGEVHPLYPGPVLLKEHSNEADGSLDSNAIDAVWLAVVRSGPDRIVVSGGKSTVQARRAGLWSTLPAASVARTSSVWSPSASPLSSTGEVQAYHEPLSSEHS